MIAIFGLLYLVLMLVIVIISGFIIFHISRYSFDKTATAAMLAVFVSVTAGLLFVNIMLLASLRIGRLVEFLY